MISLKQFNVKAFSLFVIATLLSLDAMGMEENKKDESLIRVKKKNEQSFASPKTSELHKKFYLVHKTKVIPQEPILYPAGVNKSYTHNLENPICPFTVHWSAFSDLEWNTGDFKAAIISPFSKLQEQVLIFSLAEVVTIGPYALGPEDAILVPDNVSAKTIWKDFQNIPNIIAYSHKKKLNDAIQDYLGEKGCFQIVKAEKECEWSEAYGIIDKKFRVSSYLFGKNFLETHSYVSLGTEGGIKTGKWWRIALANHYPHLVFCGLRSDDKPYQFKQWFFHIYKKNVQKIIKQLKKINSSQVEFVQSRVDDILKSLKRFADPLTEESRPSKKVFKWALFGDYKLKKGRAIYKALRDSKGEVQKLKKKKKKTYLKFLKIWDILYPSTDPSKAKKIIKKNK